MKYMLSIVLGVIMSTTMNALEVGYYQHNKGGLYYVEGVARYSEDPHKQYVIYKQLYESKLEPEGTPLHKGQLWIRPLEMFTEKVTVKGELVPRFAYLGKELPEKMKKDHRHHNDV